MKIWYTYIVCESIQKAMNHDTLYTGHAIYRFLYTANATPEQGCQNSVFSIIMFAFSNGGAACLILP